MKIVFPEASLPLTAKGSKFYSSKNVTANIRVKPSFIKCYALLLNFCTTSSHHNINLLLRTDRNVHATGLFVIVMVVAVVIVIIAGGWFCEGFRSKRRKNLIMSTT